MFSLLVFFQIKHFLADFPLQGKFMLGKFSKEPSTWIPALAAHAAVHAVLTATIVGVYCKSLEPAMYLALLDFAVHFTVDRIKASPQLLGRWQPTSPYFWWALGGDQMAHHLTHYFIIWRIV